MILGIQIVRNGIIKKTIQLVTGEYTLGREKNCDIILDHKSVSKKHGTLTILSDRAIINDTGSLNGIYYQRRKIENKSFSDDFKIEIGTFILKGYFKERAEKCQYTRSFIGNLVSSNIKIVLFLSLIILMLATFTTAYFTLNNQVKKFQRQELIKRAIILARYLSEMNKYFMEEAHYDLVKTDPVTNEEGVVYAFIVDNSGKIVAPVEDSGDFLDWAELPVAMREGRLKISEVKKNENIIFYPIKKLNKIIGAAIIGFNTAQMRKIVGTDIKENLYLYFVFLLLICVILWTILMRVIVKPLENLEEEVSIALKEGRKHLEFKSPYKEIDNLVRAFNRILVSIPRLKKGHAEETDLNNVDDKVEYDSDSFLSKLDQTNIPWCIINKESHVIIKYNQYFKDIFKESNIKQGVHVVEAFDNSEIVTAISGLIDNPESESSVPVNIDNLVKINKVFIEGETDKVMFTFEESSNG